MHRAARPVKKTCTYYKNGIHHFVFYGKAAECRCGHTLKRVNG
jgi:hypothetical protein